MTERWNILPERSRLTVAAFAPGHRFECSATGIRGHAMLDGDRLEALEAELSLDRLSAGDRLKDRELRKYLRFDAHPVARAALREAVVLSRSGHRLQGRPSFRLSVDERSADIAVEIRGTPDAATGSMTVTFTQLGYKPPKFLFLKVRDALELSVEIHMERSTA